LGYAYNEGCGRGLTRDAYQEQVGVAFCPSCFNKHFVVGFGALAANTTTAPDVFDTHNSSGKHDQEGVFTAEDIGAATSSVFRLNVAADDDDGSDEGAEGVPGDDSRPGSKATVKKSRARASTTSVSLNIGGKFGHKTSHGSSYPAFPLLHALIVSPV
jgi:hypothetical protein